MDSGVGFRELKRDLERELLKLEGVRSLVVLLGRADMLQGRQVEEEVLQFNKVLHKKWPNVKLTVSGPMPHAKEDLQTLR